MPRRLHWKCRTRTRSDLTITLSHIIWPVFPVNVMHCFWTLSQFIQKYLYPKNYIQWISKLEGLVGKMEDKFHIIFHMYTNSAWLHPSHSIANDTLKFYYTSTSTTLIIISDFSKHLLEPSSAPQCRNSSSPKINPPSRTNSHIIHSLHITLTLRPQAFQILINVLKFLLGFPLCGFKDLCSKL